MKSAPLLANVFSGGADNPKALRNPQIPTQLYPDLRPWRGPIPLAATGQHIVVRARQTACDLIPHPGPDPVQQQRKRLPSAMHAPFCTVRGPKSPPPPGGTPPPCAAAPHASVRAPSLRVEPWRRHQFTCAASKRKRRMVLMRRPKADRSSAKKAGCSYRSF